MAKLSIFRFLSVRPYLISLILVVLLGAWLAMGVNSQELTEPSTEQATEVPLAKVAYKSFVAQSIHKSIDLYGRTAPDRQAKLGAEIAGKIVSLVVDKGDRVKRNQVIALIDKQDLEIQLKRAESMLTVREKEFKAAQALNRKGLQGEVSLAKAQAMLVEAKASVSKARLSLRNTQVKAPFAGVVDFLFIEKGDFVGVGDPIATLIDLDKIVIEADVSERHIQDIKVGQPATVRFIDDQSTQGVVRYISRVSSASTNTFPIEIEVDNPQQKIPAGVSTEVEINLKDQQAVKITPAMLSLDEVGNLGVKTLKDEKLVKFVPIQLIKAEQDGVWLAGLGEKVNIITTGQGFVRDGDQVIAVPSAKQHQE